MIQVLKSSVKESILDAKKHHKKKSC